MTANESRSGANPASQPSPHAGRVVLVVVFVTILIDFIGFSVLIPVLPLFAERLGASPLQVALILTIYAIAQLLFLPAWGWVSDRIGRRPVILVSLLGTVVSFVALAFADSMRVVYLARALAGFFAASIGTAQAVVTDVTAPAERARGMGLIGAAFGAGMIVGPMLGGFAAALGEKYPFYAVAALAAANLVVAWWALPESRPADMRKPPWAEFWKSLIPAPVRLLMQVHERRIALYLYFFFHLFTAFAVLESLVTLYMSKRFGSSELDTAGVFAWIGFVLVLTQGVFLRRLVMAFGEVRLVAIGIFLMALGLAAIAFAPDYGSFFAIGTLIAIGNGVAFPSFTSLYSKACEAEQAGELLGQSQSMATTGRIVGPALGGWAMTQVSLGSPFLIAGAMMLMALALLVLLRRPLFGGL